LSRAWRRQTALLYHELADESVNEALSRRLPAIAESLDLITA